MASVSEYAKVLEEELTCSICSDVFEDPRTLQCFHKFCFECIKDWVERCNRDRQRSLCPICKDSIVLPGGDVSMLRSSFYLGSLIQLLKTMKASGIDVSNEDKNTVEVPLCCSCEKNNSLVAFCGQCGGAICQECVTIHGTLKSFKNEHQATLFTDFRKEHVTNYVRDQVHCKEKFHNKNKLEYFCQTCRLCICQKCVATKHNNHNKVSIEEAAEQAKLSMNRDIDRVMSSKEKYEQNLNILTQNMELYRTEIDTAVQSVREQAEEYRKIIHDHEAQMVSTLNRLWLEKKSSAEKEQKEIKARIAYLNDFHRHCQDLQEQNVAFTILQSPQELLERCEELLTKPPITSSLISKCNVSVEYLPTAQVTQHLKNLGKIVQVVTDPSRSSIESLNNGLCGFVNKFNVVTRNDEGQLSSAKNSIEIEVFECFGNVLLVLDHTAFESEEGRLTVEFTPISPSPCKVSVKIRGKPISNSPQLIQNRKVKKVFKAVKIFGGEGFGRGQLKGPCAMAISNSDEIAVADYATNRVAIYNVEGEFLRDFGREGVTDGELSGPCGVTFNDSNILVCDNPLSNGRVQEFDNKGNYLKTMFKEKKITLLTMCTSEEYIAVCCQGDVEIPSCIKLFDKQTGQYVMEFPGNQNHEMPFHVAYGNNTYFVTFIDNNYINVFDNKGVFMYKIGNKIKRDAKSVSNCLGGLAVYGNDDILVCDSFNNRVQLYSQAGLLLNSFGYRGDKLGGMHGPVDVVVTSDAKVLVLEYHGNRIQIWQPVIED